MPWDLFKGNYTHLIIFLVALSAVYPAVGYMKKDIYVNTDFTGNSIELDNIMKELHFERASTTPAEVTYRHRSAFIRCMRTFEDRITFTFSQGMIRVEGLRKEVVRVARNIEYFETSKKENE